MRVFHDWEFIEDGQTIAPISVGLVADDGREYYAVNADAPWDRIREHQWLCENVVPNLPLIGGRVDPWFSFSVDTSDARVKPLRVIRDDVQEFLQATPDLELWGWYSAYDHVCLAQLFGRMIDLPDGVPMWTNDIRQEAARRGNPRMPEQNGGVHDALEDARHIRAMAHYLDELEHC